MNNYLGQWIDNNAQDESNIINCISVDTENKRATFDNGLVISFMDLDLGDRFEKIRSIYDAPEVSGNLESQSQSLRQSVTPSKILGDLSKIGNRSADVAPVINEGLRSNEETPKSLPKFEYITASAEQDPVASFIQTAIVLSRKSGKKSQIPVTLELEIDFDILSIISSASTLGASDVEILQHIMKNINVDIDNVKRSLIKILISDPVDTEIVMSDRETAFNETLHEELGESKSSPVLDENGNTIEFQELK